MSSLGPALRHASALVRGGRARWLHRGTRQWAAAVAPELVARTAEPAGARVRRQSAALSSTSVAVVTVASASGRRFVVKVPCTAECADGLRRHVDTLARLRDDPRLRHLRGVLPCVVAQGEIGGRFYCVEEALPGIPASTMLARRSHRPELVLAAAARVVADLHAATARQMLINDSIVDAWIHMPLRRLGEFVASWPGGERLLDSVDRVRDELLAALPGRAVRAGWIHGDFWPGNLLVTPTGTRITGVVDWDRAEAQQLPLHDLLHLHVLSRRLARGDELGDVVVHAVRVGIEATLGRPTREIAAWLDGIPPRPAVLLYWLRHVVLFLDSEGHHDNPRWLRGNVERVLVTV